MFIDYLNKCGCLLNLCKYLEISEIKLESPVFAVSANIWSIMFKDG